MHPLEKPQSGALLKPLSLTESPQKIFAFKKEEAVSGSRNSKTAHEEQIATEVEHSLETGAKDKQQSDSGDELKESRNRDKAVGAEDSKVWDEYLDSSRKFYESGKPADAEKQLEAAFSAAEMIKGESLRADAFLKIGEQFLYLNKCERAQALMEQGLELKRKIFGFKSASTANAMDNLAQAYARSGNLQAADRIELEAISVYESLHKAETNDYAIALSNHGNTLRQLKKYKEAEPFFTRAVAVEKKLGSGDSLEAAKILLNFVGLYCDTGRLDAAQNLLDRASRIIRSECPPEHPLYKLTIKSERVICKKHVDALLKEDANFVRAEVAAAVLHLARLYEQEGDLNQAATVYEEALGIEEKLLPPESGELKAVRHSYSECLKKIRE